MIELKRFLIEAWSFLISKLSMTKHSKISKATYTEEQLREIVKPYMSTDNWLENTDVLSQKDFALIGKFIQIYCIADFNARRVIDIMREIRTGQKENFASALTEVDVLVHLRRSGEMWMGREDVREALTNLVNLLEMHRQFRHHFAHWVVRRLKGTDVFLMLTKSADNPNRRGGIRQDVDKATYAVFMADTLQDEMVKLIEQGEFLAKFASFLEGNRSSLRDEHHQSN